jgi:hypothetical protein
VCTCSLHQLAQAQMLGYSRMLENYSRHTLIVATVQKARSILFASLVTVSPVVKSKDVAIGLKMYPMRQLQAMNLGTHGHPRTCMYRHQQFYYGFCLETMSVSIASMQPRGQRLCLLKHLLPTYQQTSIAMLTDVMTGQKCSCKTVD